MVRDVLRLMDHLNIERSRVVGYSMGGKITLKLLLEHPERIQRAVVGGMGWTDGDQSPLMENLASAMDEGDFNMLTSALRPPGEESSILQEWLVSALFGLMSLRNDPIALGSVVRGFADLAATEAKLRANRVPTLVVVGTRDPLKPSVDRLDGVMQKAELIYVEGGDHGSTKTSNHFREAVTEFLAAED
jgi:pimeloyl-ACP methyl ester carboxylesterase